MKKIIMVVLLGGCSAHGMFSRAVRVPLRMPHTTEQRYAFNTHAQFGKTHFIVGHTNQPGTVFSAEQSAAADEHIISRGKKRKRSSSDTVSLLDESRSVQSFFTSRHNVRSVIADVLEHAQESIVIAAFTLTDPEVARALKKAHAAGIKVEVITDYSTMNKPHSKIQNLADAGVPVFYYNHALNQNSAKKSERFMPLMHLKLIVCDGKIVVTGSSNLTKAGQKGNVETITIIRDKKSVDEHLKEFDYLRPLCTACQFSAHS
jgi:phosphatidylserine/phosphatidylglycerophosphate/cardiolipin synthase-like enzyme